MSADKLTEFVADRVDRSRFLRRLGGAAVGVAFAGLGFRVEEARAEFGCNLCGPNVGDCDASCTWCWTSCYNGRLYHCCEGYHDWVTLCDGRCIQDGVRCSFVSDTGFSC